MSSHDDKTAYHSRQRRERCQRVSRSHSRHRRHHYMSRTSKDVYDRCAYQQQLHHSSRPRHRRHDKDVYHDTEYNSCTTKNSATSRRSSSYHQRRNDEGEGYFEKSKRRCRRSSRSRSPIARSRSPSASPERDDEGHMIVKKGQLINKRYCVERVLGEGTFGRVVQCHDRLSALNATPRRVAIKIIKAVSKYRDAARLEIEVLKCFKDADPRCDFLCVQLRDSFEYHSHVALVFDMLGESVFDWQKNNDYIGYPLDQLRYMAYQMCYSTKFMHDCGLTHTDLKPENILFVNTMNFETRWNSRLAKKEKIVADASIRLIDFGSATWEEEHHTKVVSTRHYRAPEVILQLGWSHTCDVWSLGCILLELYTGITLFMTHDNLEHLAMMERSLGPIPSKMIRRSRRKHKYFRHERLDWDADSSEGRYVRKHVKRLRDYCLEPGNPHHEDLMDLIESMLEYEPDQRITLRQALEHPFFDGLPEPLRFHRFRSSSPFARERQRYALSLYDSKRFDDASRSRSYSRFTYTGRAR